MLGAVVISFFICLIPFRALTLWIIIVPRETIINLGSESYYTILYFTRILLYMNSALNPILYNLMSSKFREGFLKLLGCKSIIRHKLFSGTRKGTFHTTSTNLSSSNSGDKRKSGRIKDDSETITGSIIIKNGLDDILVISSEDERSSSISSETKRNGFAKRKKSTFEDIDEIEEIGSDKIMMNDGGGGGGGGGGCGGGVSIDGMHTTTFNNKKKNTKEVYFGHQNGRNVYNANRRRSSSSIVAASNYKTHILSAMANKHHSQSIDSSADEIECCPDNNRITSAVYGSRKSVNRDSIDETETKLFIQHSSEPESFV